MEIDPRIPLPFRDPDEAEQSYAGAAEPSSDAQLRHLQRVPLFSGLNEEDLRRVAEYSRIVDAPAGTVITQIGDAWRQPISTCLSWIAPIFRYCWMRPRS
jgi:hypothetical protein